MAYGNNNNNSSNSNSNSVNTAGLQFYNSMQGFESTIKLGHWNGCVTLAIHPMLPENKVTEKNKWDYDVSYNVALTAERCQDLKEAIEEILQSIESENYDFTSKGVPTGANFIEIAPVSKLGIVEQGICIIIYNKLNNGIPQASKSFIFNKSSYYENYNPETGEYEKGRPLETQFKLFYITLCEAIKVATKAYSHGVRLISDWQNKMVRDSLNKLREKAGIESYSGSSYNRSGGNSNSYFNNANSNASSLYNAAYNNTEYNIPNIEDGGIIGGERLALDD